MITSLPQEPQINCSGHELPSVNMMPRHRLLKEVERQRNIRIIVINAGAGYGKTCLLSQFYSKLSGHSFWFGFNQNEWPEALIKSFAEQVSDYPGSSPDLKHAVLANSGNYRGKENNWESLAAYTHRLSTNLQTEINLFFDDFHFVNGSAAMCEAVQFLINHLPEQCRLFIATAKAPNLALGKIRTQRCLLELGAEDLKYDREDLVRFIRSAPRTKRLSGQQIDDLLDKTEGWPAAVTLMLGMEPGHAGLRLTGSNIDGFKDHSKADVLNSYINRRIWRDVDEKTKTFLTRTSLIETLAPDICGRALKLTNSAEVLSAAERQNLVHECFENGPAYRVHPLFRSFLKKQLVKQLGRAKVKELHLHFADAFLTAGDVEKAIDHFLKAGDYAKAAALIKQLWLDNNLKNNLSGQNEIPERWLEQFPLALYQQYPWLYYFQARQQELRLKTKSALSLLEKADTAFREQNDRQGIFLTLIFQARLLTALHQPARSMAKIKAAEPFAGQKSQQVKISRRLALNYLSQGRLDRAESFLQEAGNICSAAMVRENVANQIVRLYLNYYQGDFQRMLLDTAGILKKMPEDSAHEWFKHVFIFRIISLYELAYYDYSLALNSDAKARVVTSDGQEQYKRILTILMNLNLLYTRRSGAGKKALHDELKSPMLPVIYRAYILNTLGTFERRQGNFLKALELHENSLDISFKMRDRHYIACSLCNIGADKMRLYEDREDQGRQELLNALKLAKRHGYAYIECQARFHLGAKSLAAGKKNNALSELAISLNLAARQSYNHFIIEEGRSFLKPLSLAFQNQIERPYLLEIFKHIGSHTLAIVVPLLRSNDTGVRRAALRSVLYMKDPMAISYIRRLLRDRDPNIRNEAEAALIRFRNSIGSPMNILTNRELEVVRLIAVGLSNAEIGARLYISEPTVKTHITRIFNKLGINKRSQVIGLFDPASFKKTS